MVLLNGAGGGCARWGQWLPLLSDHPPPPPVSQLCPEGSPVAWDRHTSKYRWTQKVLLGLAQQDLAGARHPSKPVASCFIGLEGTRRLTGAWGRLEPKPHSQPGLGAASESRTVFQNIEGRVLVGHRAGKPLGVACSWCPFPHWKYSNTYSVLYCFDPPGYPQVTYGCFCRAHSGQCQGQDRCKRNPVPYDQSCCLSILLHVCRAHGTPLAVRVSTAS